ncbi:reprolysin-like metallopeptidase [Mesonia sp. K7]|uniref:reprolysin-like metallopeptidase n=1 Tax=Mesonia sp. K7 TaxID=2218606 RepID=UPI000DAA40C4|nr:zinc-dependent metalloprotease family protein [Mesonia sp. K7]PZD78505.1 hypothetical protein DNG35_05435 [Mesonia sp. K7]
MKTNLRHVLGLVFIFCSFSAISQNNYWTRTSEEPLSELEKTRRSSTPNNYELYHLDLESLKVALKKAPERETFTGKSPVIVEFPMGNGTFEKFRVSASSIMEEGLQVKFPNIRTYKAIGIDDPTATMRFSVTQFGLHTMSLSGKRNAVYIDPYTKDTENYIVYNRKDLPRSASDFICSTQEDIELPSLEGRGVNMMDADDSKHRTYRLAQSCNAEYGNLFANPGTEVADIQAQMTITINRVNEIYERDLAITLIFVANNDQIIYYGSTTSDPWNGEYNNTTQNVIDNIIGNANYDIGHNFNTSGGGSAGCIGCVCTTGQKGSGYTGSSNPTGDAFDIDYVAHEMGHQFGAFHTMNTCNRSGNGQTEVEPASGSSIMGYAGICPVNVQFNSDAHFNYVSIKNITSNTKTGVSSTCDVETVIANQPPVANAGNDYTIPKSTAFVLRGSATDTDGTSTLTYNWSQNDPEVAPGNGTPQPTWTQGPLYRSILPLTTPNRYMPNLSSVVNGNLTPTWEVTPSVGRTMNFSFIVRDNGSGFANGIGQTDSDLMTVTVDASSGPFIVTSQNSSGITWSVGTTETITWDVANTNNAPVNASHVNILMSTDGGQTFNVTVASNVPNSGSANIIVPSVGNISNARIMVEAANNIFYAVNQQPITIQEAEFILAFNDTDVSVCEPNNAVFNLTYNTFLGFNETTSFSTNNLPAGLTATFNPSTATTDGTSVTLTISGTDLVTPGTYNFEVIGTSPSITKTFEANVGIFNTNILVPTLTSPANQATDIINPILTWVDSNNSETYQLQIATDVNFTNIVIDTQVGQNSYTFSSASDNTTYFWRVKAINNCADSNFSAPYEFKTKSCSACPSEGNMDFQTGTTLVLFNTINNATPSVKPSPYSDFTHISTNVNKGDSYDLTINVNTDGNYAAGTMVWIDWNQNCNFDANEEYNLGYAVNTPDGPTNGSPLSITVPTNAMTGTTTMRVSTRYNNYPTSCGTGYDGEVEDYSINVGTVSTENLGLNASVNIWPNPNQGEFTIRLSANNPLLTNIHIYDITGRLIYRKEVAAQENTQETIRLNKAQTGVYFVKLSDKKGSITKKVIIE